MEKVVAPRRRDRWYHLGRSTGGAENSWRRLGTLPPTPLALARAREKKNEKRSARPSFIQPPGVAGVHGTARAPPRHGPGLHGPGGVGWGDELHGHACHVGPLRRSCRSILIELFAAPCPSRAERHGRDDLQPRPPGRRARRNPPWHYPTARRTCRGDAGPRRATGAGRRAARRGSDQAEAETASGHGLQWCWPAEGR
jgi:hypothetical protein